MILQSATGSTMLSELKRAYRDIDFYIINNAAPGRPVDINDAMALIDSDGKKYAWYTPLNNWNTYVRYPIHSFKKASQFEYKLHVFYDEPFVMKFENI